MSFQFENYGVEINDDEHEFDFENKEDGYIKVVHTPNSACHIEKIREEYDEIAKKENQRMRDLW